MQLADILEFVYVLAATLAAVGGYMRGKPSQLPAQPSSDPMLNHSANHDGDDHALLIASQAAEVFQLRQRQEELTQQNEALYQVNLHLRYRRFDQTSRAAWQSIVKEGPLLMLIEDSGTDAELLRRSFEEVRLANEVVVARDAQEAFDFLFGTGAHAGRDVSRQPALVLLDLRLPGIDGVEVLRRIRDDGRTENIPVVILTGAGDVNDIATSIELGINGFLHKSDVFNFDQLLRLVNSIGMYLLLLPATWPETRLETKGE